MRWTAGVAPEMHWIGPVSRPIDRATLLYVTGSAHHGSIAFGRAALTVEEALAICHERHGVGYRILRVYEYASRKQYRFYIKRGIDWGRPV